MSLRGGRESMDGNRAETLASRSAKLNQLVLAKGNQELPYRHLVSREALLDALFALYDECNNDHMRRNKNIAQFLEKYYPAITELRKLQVNVNDFDRQKIIGKGHFGEVHLVQEKQSGNVYAMKILQKSLTLEQQSVAFYEEERDIMMKGAGNPWLTSLQYAFQDGRNLYLVMEFLPGGDMLSLLERNDNLLPEDVSQFYLAEIVLALHSLHAMGYVHRDIKPDNILIDRTGHIKLADFGSAAKLNDAKQVTSKMPVGTPDYIAPEVLTTMNKGAGPHYGVGCDWWSLGIVAYEMLFGVTPFGDDKVLVTYANIMNFKEKLSFPDDIVVSDSAISLIKGLLQEAKTRLTYKELYDQDFFKDIDWMNLQKLAPPYVPTVSGHDDTSHFDEFDADTSRKVVEPFNPKKEFSGKNLPFVGFTYSCCLSYVSEMYGGMSETLNSLSSSGSFMRSSLTLPRNHGRSSSGNSKETQLKKQVVALEAVESSLKSEVSLLQVRSKRAQELCTLQQEEKDKALEQNKEYEAEVKSLRHMLELERKNLSNTEKRAVELLKAIELKYKKREALLKEAAMHLLPSLSNHTGSGLLALGSSEENKSVEHQLRAAQLELSLCKQELAELRELPDHKLDILNEQISSSSSTTLGSSILSHNSSGSCSSTLTNGRTDITVIPNDFGKREELWQEQLKQSEEGRHQAEQRAKRLSADLHSLSSQQELELKDMQEEYSQQLEALKNVITRLEASSHMSPSMNHSSSDIPNRESDIQLDGLHGRSDHTEILQDKLRVLEADMMINAQFLESLQKKYGRLKETSSKTIHALESDLAAMRAAKEESERALCQQELNFKDQLKNQEAAVVEQLSLANEVFKEKLGQLQLRTKEVDVALCQLENEGQDKPSLDIQLDPCNEKAAAVPPSELSFKSSAGSSLLSPEVLHKMLSMEAVLHKIHETQISESNQLWELKGKLWKCEKEVTDRQLDVRIAEREKREAQEALSQSRESHRHLRERLSALDKEHAQCSQRNSTLKDQLASAAMETAAKDEAWQGKLNRISSEKLVLEERILALKEERKSAKDLEEQCARSEGQYQELDRQNERLKDQCEKLEDEKQYLLGEVESLQLDLKNKTKHCQQQEKSVQALKSACTTLEGMSKDLESALETKERELLHSKQAEASLQRELEKLRRELKTTEDNVQTERKYREERDAYLAEVRVEYKSEIENLQERRSSLEEELNLQTEAVQQLSAQMYQLEKNLQSQFALKKAAEAKNAHLEDEIVRVKEEASIHITTIAQLKHKSIDLQESLESSEARVQEALWTIEQMQNDHEREKASFHQELLKQDSQLQQHAKLIDLLQQRLREQSEKKKKWLFGIRGGGGKENKGPVPPVRPPVVEKKRDRGFRHYVELQEAMPKIYTGTEAGIYVTTGIPHRTSSRGSVDEVSLAGSSSSEDSLRCASSFHRFHEPPTRPAAICVVCDLAIPAGKVSVKCRGCDTVCHRYCKEHVNQTCHPPFQATITQASFKRPLNSADSKNMNGVVKVPRSRNAGWEQRFMRLVGGTKLWISDKEIPTDPSLPPPVSTQVLDLCPSDGVVTLKRALTPSDVQYNTSDVQCMIKLTTWPDKQDQNTREQILLLGEYEAKWRWCQALERPLSKHLQRKRKIIGYSELKSSLVLSLEKSPLQVTCCHHLTKQHLLLGSVEGLFLIDLSFPPHQALKGRLLPESSNPSPTKSLHHHLPEAFPVHKVVLARRLGVVLVVAGADRTVVAIQAADILKWVEYQGQGCGPLNLTPVGLLKGIMHLEVSQCTDVTPVVLAACSLDTFYLLKWNVVNRQFVTKQEVKLCQPCVALHISPEVILFAADKVYVVDLKEPGTCVEDFLDSTNANALTLVVNDILKRQSSPMAIFTSQPAESDGPQPKPVQEEYLLLTRDMGVLVNYLGQQDQQNQLGWALQPNSFAYCSPFVFALDSQQVEMILIDPYSANLRADWSFLDLSQAQFLGLSSEEEPSNEERAIYISAVSPGPGNVVEVFKVKGKTLLARNFMAGQPDLHRNISTVSRVSDTFSFTSSIEDILETGDSSTC